MVGSFVGVARTICGLACSIIFGLGALVSYCTSFKNLSHSLEYLAGRSINEAAKGIFEELLPFVSIGYEIFRRHDENKNNTITSHPRGKYCYYIPSEGICYSRHRFEGAYAFSRNGGDFAQFTQMKFKNPYQKVTR